MITISHHTVFKARIPLTSYGSDRINGFLCCWAVSFPTNIVDWGITLVSRLMGPEICWTCTQQPLFNVLLLSCTCINSNLYTQPHQASAICWMWTRDSESCLCCDVSAEKMLDASGWAADLPWNPAVSPNRWLGKHRTTSWQGGYVRWWLIQIFHRDASVPPKPPHKTWFMYIISSSFAKPSTGSLSQSLQSLSYCLQNKKHVNLNASVEWEQYLLLLGIYLWIFTLFFFTTAWGLISYQGDSHETIARSWRSMLNYKTSIQ